MFSFNIFIRYFLCILPNVEGFRPKRHIIVFSLLDSLLFVTMFSGLKVDI